MAEKEYIEREAVMQKFAGHVKRSNNSDFAPVPTWNQAVQIVEDFPAAEVMPVVLCRDCVYLPRDKYGAWCFTNYEANLKDDDFCSRGVKQEEENDEKT